MSVYKLLRCSDCGYKKRESKLVKAGFCPKCSAPLYYSKNFYFSYYMQGKKYEKVAGPNRKAALEAECKMKVDVAEGKAYIPTSWKNSVEELEETYRILSPKTVGMYRNCVVKLSMSFGLMNLSDITERHLKIYKSQRLQEGMSASSFNRDRSTLKRIFALSGVEWRFKKSAFTMEKETVRKRILSDEERDRLMSACKKVPYLFTAVLVALDTGLRKTSLLTLQWKDINFKSNLIIKEGKGEKIHRIPMTKRVKEHLLKYRSQQKVLSMWIFPSQVDIGKPITDIRKSFQAACKEARITGLNLHDLRRTFGSMVTMSTKDITLASALLGHSDISITRKHYGHLLDSHLQEGINLFEEKTR